MTLILGIFIGLVIGAAFHLCRTREIRAALKAACGQLKMSDRRLGAQEKVISNIRGLLLRSRSINLSGTAPLPATAEQSRQLVRMTAPLSGAVETAGPSRNGGSGFLGR